MPTVKRKKKKKVKIKKSGIRLVRASKLVEKYPWLNVVEFSAILNGGHFNDEGVLCNSDGCIRCTCVVKSTGKRCKNFAVPGETCCHIHGGLRGRIAAGKRRIYSAFIKDSSLKGLYEDVSNSKQVQDVREELGLLRALLAKRLGDMDTMDTEEVKGLAAVIKEIRQLVSEATKSQLKLGQLIDIGKITIIVGALARIVAKHVTSKETLEKIANEFDNIILPTSVGGLEEPAEEPSTGEVPKITGKVL